MASARDRDSPPSGACKDCIAQVRTAADWHRATLAAMEEDRPQKLVDPEPIHTSSEGRPWEGWGSGRKREQQGSLPSWGQEKKRRSSANAAIDRSQARGRHGRLEEALPKYMNNQPTIECYEHNTKYRGGDQGGVEWLLGLHERDEAHGHKKVLLGQLAQSLGRDRPHLQQKQTIRTKQYRKKWT